MSRRDELLTQLAQLGEVQVAYQQSMGHIRKVFENDPAEVSRMVNATERAMKRVTRKQNELSKSLRELDKAAGNEIPPGGQYVYTEGDEVRGRIH